MKHYIANLALFSFMISAAFPIYADNKKVTLASEEIKPPSVRKVVMTKFVEKETKQEIRSFKELDQYYKY